MNINLNEAMEEYAQLPFRPYGAHYKKYAAGHREPGYTTKLSSFIFALSGDAWIYLEDKPFQFGANRVIHCSPNQHFTAQGINGQPTELYELAYINESSSSVYMSSSYELEISNNPHMFSMLYNLSQLSQRVYPELDGISILQAKTLTYSILSEMFSSAQITMQSGTHSIVEDAKLYLGHHYREPHTLYELGRRYGMSGNYFSCIFKQYTGISPIDYLITCRLETAKKLLQSTVFSIKEISYSVGYEDALYFSRHFKSRFHISPSEWRNNQQKLPKEKLSIQISRNTPFQS